MFLQETHFTVHGEKRWQDELKKNFFSHMGIATLTEWLLVS